ncbi:MAG: cytochrome c oxidase subunit 3 [Acidithiobacillus caldus]|jgi:cytochrome o ubiquinol oxidase subunit 3|uniref:Cytochrome O ubiquinol oxidase subunit III n=1 Tax=Acidithiobacillus caldus (strain SM-1) TaxID=990288 RepID=F9ZPL2_ACICS|nr:cytochrome c oxidase subunit 3 [Acidithiobacillus caldus]AEK56837.1 Cytochrome O ubiquinol oxidase subunit III [Acidithiobacillus caldus SM-1]MBU2822187.1 cytochrome O ubiquinol oxidase [Acidithiobacillus caldus]WMT47840.1 MAG: cytochrome c oxidase subunit 3 [Acidithiobacillus caldus]
MSATTTQKIDPKGVTLWERHYPGPDLISTRTFGFWLYMLTDAMVYAALFASLGVLSHVVNLAGGPPPAAIIDPVYAYGETITLFLSVLAYGYSMVALKSGNRGGVIGGILVSMLLGVVFLAIAATDIGHLFSRGIIPETSGFLSIFFTILIYHALHILVGIVWMLVMIAQIARDGFTANVVYRLINLRLFWHFQAVIWVFVFTFVYLQGMVA